MSTTPGIHHVSAIAGDPQENVDFYTEILGLRLVKQTVNFDEKFMYHLYNGDARGSPGSLLTFFPYQRGMSGRVGRPQPVETAFSVPQGAIPFWHDRLETHDLPVDAPVERFGEPMLSFKDHDGLPLALVERASERPPGNAPIPAANAIRGMHSVTLLSTSVYQTAATLEVLRYSLIGQEDDRVRYQAPGTEAEIVDILDADLAYGREGIGTIHHVAFRSGSQSLSAWRTQLAEAGLHPTWIRDRRYFESIYFREPGGILFEIATDGPGFTVDESQSNLGRTFQLPPQYAEDRDMITQQLPALTLTER